MEKATIEIGKKVRWYYKAYGRVQIDKEVMIASEPLPSIIEGRRRVRIVTFNPDGSMLEGGYVNDDELFEL